MRDPRMTLASTAAQHSAFSKVLWGSILVPASMALTKALHLVGRRRSEHGNAAELGHDFPGRPRAQIETMMKASIERHR